VKSTLLTGRRLEFREEVMDRVRYFRFQSVLTVPGVFLLKRGVIKEVKAPNERLREK
jgi:hypothetical protein